jgi:lysine/ornithine N-monooxygenase
MCNNQREEKNPPKHMLHRKIKAFYPSQTSSFFLSGHPMFMNHNALQFHKIQTLERHGFLSKNSTIYKGSVFFSFLFFYT